MIRDLLNELACILTGHVPGPVHGPAPYETRCRRCGSATLFHERIEAIRDQHKDT